MNFRRQIVGLALAVTAAAASAQGAPRVEEAWAHPTVAGQAAGGGFVKITSPVADRLIAARTTAAKAVELHTMQMDGDVMRMRQVPAIDLPAGKTVELKPGGLHLMLMGPTKPLAEGASFPLTLRFEKAGEVTVDVKVTARAPDPMAGHKH